MIALAEVRQRMDRDSESAILHLFEFVDEFRRVRDVSALEQPFVRGNERWDALTAATAESLCKEIGEEAPPWLADIPACRQPWFVSGLESLKAIALVESPLPFRLRQIFVLENFLSRA